MPEMASDVVCSVVLERVSVDTSSSRKIMGPGVRRGPGESMSPSAACSKCGLRRRWPGVDLAALAASSRGVRGVTARVRHRDLGRERTGA
jgi:hypothetical protein